ncbi:MAG: aromatic ring-hydroxylating dioxygenase subunit alpha [Candidatus Binataceae bacterium]|nr:aromatic ring-hydroxylating dioxygenase subunit alpha [Candidatus Binataceae bacterium]
MEIEKIFGRLWILVGLELEIPHPGDFKTTYIGEAPVVVVRDLAGKVRVFENVCVHRGTKLVRSSCGSAQAFKCMYHQWTYALDGRLIGVPLSQGYGPSFVKENYSLPELPRVETFAGLIYASYDRSIAPLEQYLGGFAAYAREIMHDGDVEFMGFQRYHVKANWKLFVENTIDGYHPGLLHMPIMLDRSNYAYQPGVGKSAKFGHGHGLLQWPVTRATDWDPLKDLPLTACLSRSEGWNYVSDIFPNTMLLQIEDILTVRQVIPRGHEAVDVITYNLAVKGESEEIKRHRALVVSAQFGIAGVASLDDKLVMEAAQAGAPARYTGTILLRGKLEAGEGDLTDEVSLRGFYEGWVEAMTA